MYLILLSVKQGGIKYHFLKSFVWRDLVLNSCLLAHWRTLYSEGQWASLPPCLTLSNIRYISRVKWSNSGKGVAPSPTPRCSSYWKGSFLVTNNKKEKKILLTMSKQQAEINHELVAVYNTNLNCRKHLFSNPSAQAGYDKRSILSRV